MRVRRRGDVKLQGNATDSFVFNASIVDFFATMIGISIIDILLVDRFFFNVSCTRPALLCGMDADVNADCTDAGAQARGVDAV